VYFWHNTVCAHECYYSQFTCKSRSLCSFLSKSLFTVGQGCWMYPAKSPPKPVLFNAYCHSIDVICIVSTYCVDSTRPTQLQ
jgi:hypothetical protein